MRVPYRLMFVAVVAAVVAPSSAGAQVIEPMKFTTPFAFSVGHTNFAAGSYVARPLDGDPTVVCIQGDHGGPAAIVAGMPDQPRHRPRGSEITFVREGSRLVLQSLWDDSASEGLEVPPVTAVTAK